MAYLIYSLLVALIAMTAWWSYATMRTRNTSKAPAPRLAIAWFEELDRLFYGCDDVDPLEIIGTHLKEIDNTPQARTHLIEAIERFVGTWNSSQGDDADHVSQILRLISIYTPRAGFAKVVSLFRSEALNSIQCGADTADRLRLQGLRVLAEYFPSSPVDDARNASLAFSVYLDILTAHLDDPACAGEALCAHARLGFDNDALRPLVRRIDRESQALGTVIQTLLKYPNYPFAQRLMTVVYERFLVDGRHREFRELVISCGAGLDLTGTRPEVIVFRTQSPNLRVALFELTIGETLRQRYWDVYCLERPAHLDEELDELVRSFPAPEKLE